MKRALKIGTRDSELALWQAKTVQKKLKEAGFESILVPVKSEGDLVLDKPLYEMGITGIFTKTLDVAMLQGKVDIAVHSMKDVPTQLPKGIIQAAVLKRATATDILVTKKAIDYTKPCTIATGSLRRKAQWLHRYPSHQVVDLRGNVNTRLEKLNKHPWEGAIFAKAGLERINVLPETYTTLDWMIPAPAQGAMVVVALENDAYALEATQLLNDETSYICTQIERQFLRKLEGGCTAPIGAIANIIDKKITFKGALFSLDGSQKVEIEQETTLENYTNFGEHCAIAVLNNGGKQLMEAIKKEL